MDRSGIVGVRTLIEGPTESARTALDTRRCL